MRYSSGMKAYFLGGDRGVTIATSGGKKFLIGSDHPDLLAAVIRAVAGISGDR